MHKLIHTVFILLTIIFPLFIIPSLNEIYIYPKIALVSCFLALLIFLWAFKVRFSSEMNFSSLPFFWPIILFLGVNLLSLLKAGNIYEGLYSILWLFSCTMMFFLAVNNLHIESLHRFILWNILGAIIVSGVGIAQFWGLQIPILPFPLGSTLGTKNMSAQYIILILPLAFIAFFWQQETRKELFYGLGGAVMAIFLIYTESRGSWVGIIGASLFMLIILWKNGCLLELGTFLQINRKKIFILFLCLGVVVLGVAATHIIEVPRVTALEGFNKRFQSIFGVAHPSAQSRLAMWANTLDMIRDNYLLGVGVGNWKFIYPLYSRSRVVDPIFSEQLQPRDAHNDWVQVPAEIGLGFLVFIWLIFKAYKVGCRVFIGAIKSPSGADRYPGLIAFFLLISISGLLINAFFDFPLEHPVPLFYFWMFLAFLQIISSPLSSPPSFQSKSSRNHPIPQKILALLLFIAHLILAAFAVSNVFYLKASYYFQQGMNLAEEGRIPEAIVHFEKAISLAPFEYRYYTELSRIYFIVKEYDKVALMARIALLYHPNYINAWNNLGAAFGKAGLLPDAEGSLKKALAIYPDYFSAHVNLGSVYTAMGEIEKAKKEYRVALSIKPDSQELLDRLEALEKPR